LFPEETRESVARVNGLIEGARMYLGFKNNEFLNNPEIEKNSYFMALRTSTTAHILLVINMLLTERSEQSRLSYEQL
jgi:hypothetical protein